jgi:hypothetical protein
MAVRTLKPKDQAAALAAVPDAPSLAERLAEAQKAAEPTGRRVAELEQAMQGALAGQDYAAAERIKDELAVARREHGITSAAVIGLQSAIVEAERRQAEDTRILQEAQARTEAQRVIGAAMAGERRALEGIDKALEEFWSMVEAAKAAYQRAVSWEEKAYHERARAHQAHVALGERPNGVHITRPNKASVLGEQNELVRKLIQWAR